MSVHSMELRLRLRLLPVALCQLRFACVLFVPIAVYVRCTLLFGPLCHVYLAAQALCSYVR